MTGTAVFVLAYFAALAGVVLACRWLVERIDARLSGTNESRIRTDSQEGKEVTRLIGTILGTISAWFDRLSDEIDRAADRARTRAWDRQRRQR